ncbi:MAG: chromosome partitioning protein ParB [Chloroflexi bacterium]|nr:chromosome partitioning protein ParB [Chloroflexota bacterium]
MTSNKANIKEEIRLLELDSLSAQKWAKEGKVEEWVHKYLLSGKGGKSNLEFSKGFKRDKRWWNESIEINLTDLSPAVGTDPGMEYEVDNDYWYARTSQLAESFTDPLFLPPLIAEYRAGELSVRDGNTRHGAMCFLGWAKCWVIIWYNLKDDYFQHNSLLLAEK